MIPRKKEWDPEEIKTSILAKCESPPAETGFEEGCLLWTGYTDNDGYGKGMFFQRSIRVHIASYLAEKGLENIPLTPDGQKQLVRHRCRNRNCCRPSHLELGTPQQNSDDMKRDGTVRSGENATSAKITQDVAAAIKMSWKPQGATGYQTQQERADAFEVSLGTVRNIDNGDSWKDLPSPQGKPGKSEPIRIICDRESLSGKDYTTMVKRIFKKCTSQIKEGHKDPCMIFNGATGKSGYGQIDYQNRTFRTHVVVCESTAGQRTPKGMVVRHRCGEKKCCQPTHLQFGTNSENRVDAFRHGDVTAKLTMTDVIQIRLKGKTETVKSLADEYKVSMQTITKIIKRQAWLFVEDED